MGVLYSLYDALVSINVPNEKALAVADAMEQDMLEKLATKADLAALNGEVRAEFKLMRQEIGAMQSSLSKDISNVSNSLMLKFGAMTAGAVVLICTVIGTIILLR